jgi:ADP-ribose pyrophosphatase YjhB (NUDIX family)
LDPHFDSSDLDDRLQQFGPTVVAVLIRAPDGLVWLIERGFDPGRGLWTIPGGAIDAGERPTAAGVREIREELQLDVVPDGLVGTYARRHDPVRLAVFTASSDATPTPTAEAPRVGLFSHETAPWQRLAFWSTAAALRDYWSR